jgi:hypothetical protein
MVKQVQFLIQDILLVVEQVVEIIVLLLVLQTAA